MPWQKECVAEGTCNPTGWGTRGFMVTCVHIGEKQHDTSTTVKDRYIIHNILRLIWTPSSWIILPAVCCNGSNGQNFTFLWLRLSQFIGGWAEALWLDFPRLSPATIPDDIVAMSGVFVLGLIRAKALKSTPSSAIAKITRGIGKMEPRRLNKTAETCRTTH